MHARMHACIHTHAYIFTSQYMHHTHAYVKLRYVTLRYVMYVCMYVCMYLCMYACMHVCIHVRMYVCMYACTYVCMYVWMYACMHACMHRRLLNTWQDCTGKSDQSNNHIHSESGIAVRVGGDSNGQVMWLAWLSTTSTVQLIKSCSTKAGIGSKT